MRPALGFAAASAGRVLLACSRRPGVEIGARTWLIHRITIRAMDPAALTQFYIDVYGFKEEEKASEDPNFYLTDGTVTLVLTPWKIKDYYGTEHKAPGMDHIGFKVEISKPSNRTWRCWPRPTPSGWRRNRPTSKPNIM